MVHTLCNTIYSFSLEIDLNNEFPIAQRRLRRSNKAIMGTPVFEPLTGLQCFDYPIVKTKIAIAMRQLLLTTPLVAVSSIAGDSPASTIKCRHVYGNHFIIRDGESTVTTRTRLLASLVALALAYQTNIIIQALNQ